MKTRRDWSSYNTMEDLQKFIDTNGIKTMSDLRRNYQGLVIRVKTKDPNFNPKKFKF